MDVLVLQLGINDVFRGVPLEEIRGNLQAMIDRTERRDPRVRVVIAGMRLPLGGTGYLQDFGQLFGALAEKNRAALVPYLLEGVGGDPTLNLPIASTRTPPGSASWRKTSGASSSRF